MTVIENQSSEYFKLLSLVTGFPAVRENLENLAEKGLFLEKVRENLEKSGNFCKFSEKSDQGIYFQNALNLMVFSQSWNLYFSKTFLSDPTMVGPPNDHDNH